MRIELRDMSSYMLRVCDTTDMELMAQWFKSWLPELMKTAGQSRMQWQIQMWPSDETEYAYFGRDSQKLTVQIPQFVNSVNMRKLASAFDEAAEQMERVEKRANG